MNGDWSFIFPVALLGLIAILFLSQLRKRESFPYKAKNYLLTDAEFAFFTVLEKCITAQQLIAPKVRLGDVIGCSERDWALGHGPKISSKHLDFVIMDRRSSRILLAIELDDSSHRHPDRVARDKFLNQAMEVAEVPLLRVQVARTYNDQDLKHDIAKIVSQHERQHRD